MYKYIYIHIYIQWVLFITTDEKGYVLNGSKVLTSKTVPYGNRYSSDNF
jgi:hypothetical protein